MNEKLKRNTDKELASNLLRVLWVPKKGDRIIIQRDIQVRRKGRGKKGETFFVKKLKKGTIVGVYDGLYLTTAWPGKMLISSEMRFVPVLSDFISFLRTLDGQGVISLNAEGSDMVLSRRFKRYNYTTRQEESILLNAKGSPIRLVASLLESRKVDEEFNAIINGMVERVRAEKKAQLALLS